MPKLVVETAIDTNGVDKGIAEIEKKLDKLQKKRVYEFEYDSGGASGSTTLVKDLTDEEKRYEERLLASLDKLRERKEILEQNKMVEQEITNQTAQQVSNVNRWVDGVMTTSNGNRYVLKTEEDRTNEEEEQNEQTRKHIASLNKVGLSLEKILKKVSRWGLAIIGIRSAYSGIRRAMNLVQSNNEEIANTFKVMSMAVANTLTPVVEKIVNIIKTLMQYVDYIYFRLTNKHLFDFTKAFKDANKNAQGVANSVSKTQTSFDEMNVIQDNSSGGGGGGMAENPFEGWENFQPPEWLEKLGNTIKKLADIIKKYWKGIVVALIVAGVALIVSKFAKAKEGITGLGGTFKGFFDGIGKGIEAIAVLGGLALVIYTVTELINAFSESGLKVTDVVGLMATIFGTIIVLMGAIALLGPSMTAGLVPFTILVAEISAILLVMKATLPVILEAVGDFITTTAPALVMVLDSIGANISSIIHSLGDVLPPIIDSVGKTFEKIFNGISKVINTVGDVIVKIMNTAKDSVITVLGAILSFIERLGPAINKLVDNIIVAVTKLINFMISGIEYMINTLVIGGIRGMIKKINDVIPGGEYDIGLPSYVQIERFRPRLAKGGIVNMPGRGVPVGGATVAERAPEGIIPLTDSQQMALLGEAIGKFININATVPVYVGNRLLMREMKRIEAEDSFAYNR